MLIQHRKNKISLWAGICLSLIFLTPHLSWAQGRDSSPAPRIGALVHLSIAADETETPEARADSVSRLRRSLTAMVDGSNMHSRWQTWSDAHPGQIVEELSSLLDLVRDHERAFRDLSREQSIDATLEDFGPNAVLLQPETIIDILRVVRRLMELDLEIRHGLDALRRDGTLEALIRHGSVGPVRTEALNALRFGAYNSRNSNAISMQGFRSDLGRLLKDRDGYRYMVENGFDSSFRAGLIEVLTLVSGWIENGTISMSGFEELQVVAEAVVDHWSWFTEMPKANGRRAPTRIWRYVDKPFTTDETASGFVSVSETHALLGGLAWALHPNNAFFPWMAAEDVLARLRHAASDLIVRHEDEGDPTRLVYGRIQHPKSNVSDRDALLRFLMHAHFGGIKIFQDAQEDAHWQYTMIVFHGFAVHTITDRGNTDVALLIYLLRMEAHREFLIAIDALASESEVEPIACGLIAWLIEQGHLEQKSRDAAHSKAGVAALTGRQSVGAITDAVFRFYGQVNPHAPLVLVVTDHAVRGDGRPSGGMHLPDLPRPSAELVLHPGLEEVAAAQALRRLHNEEHILAEFLPEERLVRLRNLVKEEPPTDPIATFSAIDPASLGARYQGYQGSERSRGGARLGEFLGASDVAADIESGDEGEGEIQGRRRPRRAVVRRDSEALEAPIIEAPEPPAPTSVRPPRPEERPRGESAQDRLVAAMMRAVRTDLSGEIAEQAIAEVSAVLAENPAAAGRERIAIGRLAPDFAALLGDGDLSNDARAHVLESLFILAQIKGTGFDGVARSVFIDSISPASTVEELLVYELSGREADPLRARVLEIVLESGAHEWAKEAATSLIESLFTERGAYGTACPIHTYIARSEIHTLRALALGLLSRATHGQADQLRASLSDTDATIRDHVIETWQYLARERRFARLLTEPSSGEEHAASLEAVGQLFGSDLSLDIVFAARVRDAALKLRAHARAAIERTVAETTGKAVALFSEDKGAHQLWADLLFQLAVAPNSELSRAIGALPRASEVIIPHVRLLRSLRIQSRNYFTEGHPERIARQTTGNVHARAANIRLLYTFASLEFEAGSTTSFFFEPIVKSCRRQLQAVFAGGSLEPGLVALSHDVPLDAYQVEALAAYSVYAGLEASEKEALSASLNRIVEARPDLVGEVLLDAITGNGRLSERADRVAAVLVLQQALTAHGERNEEGLLHTLVGYYRDAQAVVDRGLVLAGYDQNPLRNQLEASCGLPITELAVAEESQSTGESPSGREGIEDELTEVTVVTLMLKARTGNRDGTTAAIDMLEELTTNHPDRILDEAEEIAKTLPKFAGHVGKFNLADDRGQAPLGLMVKWEALGVDITAGVRALCVGRKSPLRKLLREEKQYRKRIHLISDVLVMVQGVASYDSETREALHRAFEQELLELYGRSSGSPNRFIDLFDALGATPESAMVTRSMLLLELRAHLLQIDAMQPTLTGREKAKPLTSDKGLAKVEALYRTLQKLTMQKFSGMAAPYFDDIFDASRNYPSNVVMIAFDFLHALFSHDSLVYFIEVFQVTHFHHQTSRRSRAGGDADRFLSSYSQPMHLLFGSYLKSFQDGGVARLFADDSLRPHERALLVEGAAFMTFRAARVKVGDTAGIGGQPVVDVMPIVVSFLGSLHSGGYTRRMLSIEALTQESTMDEARIVLTYTLARMICQSFGIYQDSGVFATTSEEDQEVAQARRMIMDPRFDSVMPAVVNEPEIPTRDIEGGFITFLKGVFGYTEARRREGLREGQEVLADLNDTFDQKHVKPRLIRLARAWGLAPVFEDVASAKVTMPKVGSTVEALLDVALDRAAEPLARQAAIEGLRDHRLRKKGPVDLGEREGALFDLMNDPSLTTDGLTSLFFTLRIYTPEKSDELNEAWQSAIAEGGAIHRFIHSIDWQKQSDRRRELFMGLLHDASYTSWQTCDQMSRLLLLAAPGKSASYFSQLLENSTDINELHSALQALFNIARQIESRLAFAHQLESVGAKRALLDEAGGLALAMSAALKNETVQNLLSLSPDFDAPVIISHVMYFLNGQTSPAAMRYRITRWITLDAVLQEGGDSRLATLAHQVAAAFETMMPQCVQLARTWLDLGRDIAFAADAELDAANARDELYELATQIDTLPEAAVISPELYDASVQEQLSHETANAKRASLDFARWMTGQEEELIASIEKAATQIGHYRQQDHGLVGTPLLGAIMLEEGYRLAFLFNVAASMESPSEALIRCVADRIEILPSLLNFMQAGAERRDGGVQTGENLKPIRVHLGVSIFINAHKILSKQGNETALEHLAQAAVIIEDLSVLERAIQLLGDDEMLSRVRERAIPSGIRRTEQGVTSWGNLDDGYAYSFTRLVMVATGTSDDTLTQEDAIAGVYDLSSRRDRSVFDGSGFLQMAPEYLKLATNEGLSPESRRLVIETVRVWWEMNRRTLDKALFPESDSLGPATDLFVSLPVTPEGISLMAAWLEVLSIRMRTFDAKEDVALLKELSFLFSPVLPGEESIVSRLMNRADIPDAQAAALHFLVDFTEATASLIGKVKMPGLEFSLPDLIHFWQVAFDTIPMAEHVQNPSHGGLVGASIRALSHLVGRENSELTTIRLTVFRRQFVELYEAGKLAVTRGGDDDMEVERTIESMYALFTKKGANISHALLAFQLEALLFGYVNTSTLAWPESLVALIEATAPGKLEPKKQLHALLEAVRNPGPSLLVTLTEAKLGGDSETWILTELRSLASMEVEDDATIMQVQNLFSGQLKDLAEEALRLLTDPSHSFRGRTVALLRRGRDRAPNNDEGLYRNLLTMVSTRVLGGDEHATGVFAGIMEADGRVMSTDAASGDAVLGYFAEYLVGRQHGFDVGATLEDLAVFWNQWQGDQGKKILEYLAKPYPALAGIVPEIDQTRSALKEVPGEELPLNENMIAKLGDLVKLSLFIESQRPSVEKDAEPIFLMRMLRIAAQFVYDLEGAPHLRIFLSRSGLDRSPEAKWAFYELIAHSETYERFLEDPAFVRDRARAAAPFSAESELVTPAMAVARLTGAAEIRSMITAGPELPAGKTLAETYRSMAHDLVVLATPARLGTDVSIANVGARLVRLPMLPPYIR